MKRNSILKGVFVFLFMMMATLVVDVEACAAVPTWEELSYVDDDRDYCCFVGLKKATKTCNKFDVTGDKKKDTVKIVYTPKDGLQYEEDVVGQLKIFVNGKCVFKQKRSQRPEWLVQIIQLKNGKVFFSIQSTIGSWDAPDKGLYQYRSGKLKKVLDLNPFYIRGYEVVKVTGNKIILRAEGSFNLTGHIAYDVSLVYKKGKLRLASKRMKCYGCRTGRGYENVWTATHTMKVYKKMGSKKVAFKIKEDSKITIKKVIYEKNKIYFQVQELTGKKRTGYMPEPKNYRHDNGTGYGPHHFNECQFVG